METVNLDPLSFDGYGCPTSPHDRTESDETRRRRERLAKQGRLLSLAEQFFVRQGGSVEGAYQAAQDFLEYGKDFFESWPPVE